MLSANLLRDELEGTGVDFQTYEIGPRAGSHLISPVARHRPRRRPALCLMGHTDVVPVSPEGWTSTTPSGAS